MSQKIRIVFMGTPEFATTILKKLVQEHCEIVGVVTAPDKPAGRGQKLHESDVKKYASSLGIPILQPTSLKAPEFIDELKSLRADLFVVVAFRMLPEVVWQMPPLGTINLHGSLLPNYRGAAPINWAVINGDSETGVTTFFIEKEIDTGSIIEQQHMSIGPNETVGEVHDRMMHLGAETVWSTVQKIAQGKVTSVPQNERMSDLHHLHAPKIFKEDCLIDPAKTAQEVHNFIRGLSPYPAAWILLKNEQGQDRSFKIFTSTITTNPSRQPGTIRVEKTGLFIGCSDFEIQITELQPEGKRRMAIDAFYAGNREKWTVSN